MKRIISLMAISFIVAGCSAIPLDPQASHVLVTPNQAPKGCKFVGQIFGNQGNSFTGGFTSNVDLEKGAMNDMRNQASKMGANYVQLITSRAGITGSGALAGDRNAIGGSSSSAQTNITNTGNAYTCPASAL
ncbi:MAG: DUF4156 domain-containing protein [Gammaproteobacteria bacterium]